MICSGSEGSVVVGVTINLHPFTISSIRINGNINTRFSYAVDDTPMNERDEVEVCDHAFVFTWAL
jgi:hypothetical protein